MNERALTRIADKSCKNCPSKIYGWCKSILLLNCIIKNNRNQIYSGRKVTMRKGNSYCSEFVGTRLIDSTSIPPKIFNRMNQWIFLRVSKPWPYIIHLSYLIKRHRAVREQIHIKSFHSPSSNVLMWILILWKRNE